MQPANQWRVCSLGSLITHASVDSFNAPVYRLRTLHVRLKLPVLTISVVSDAATTPIGVEIIVKDTEVIIDTPSRQTKVTSDAQSTRDDSLQVMLVVRTLLQVDYLALHATPILEPWSLMLKANLSNQSRIFFGGNENMFASDSSIGAVVTMMVQAPDLMRLRVDTDHLRGLLYLMREFQRLDVTMQQFSPTSKRDSAGNRLSVAPVVANANAGDNSAKGTRARGRGISVRNLTGVALRVRLSQFRLCSRQPEGLMNPEGQHTTEWCVVNPIPLFQGGDFAYVADMSRCVLEWSFGKLVLFRGSGLFP